MLGGHSGTGSSAGSILLQHLSDSYDETFVIPLELVEICVECGLRRRGQSRDKGEGSHVARKCREEISDPSSSTTPEARQR